MRAIEHAAVETRDACSRIGRERSHHAFRMLDLGYGGRKGLVDHRNLIRVNGELGRKSISPCPSRLALQARTVPEVCMNTVDRLHTRGCRSDQTQRTCQLENGSQRAILLR